MSIVYYTGGAAVYPHRHIVEVSGRPVRVRPKTFELLLLLLDHPQQTLSKPYLLDTVWDDVAVDEQVLFQSVREIRQLFGNNELIKNYPRKGYAWTAEVEKRDARAKAAGIGRWKLGALAASLVVACAALVYGLTRPQHTSLDGPVLVLPVKNRVADNNHNWVPLGGMDHLIALLSEDKDVTVLDTEYVLEAMRRANLERNYTSEAITPLFTQTGGVLVVESELTGYVADYRLHYRLHFPNDSKRGTLMAATVDEALAQLGQIVARYTGQALATSPTKVDSEFGSELMARAMEQWDKGDYALAVKLFESLIKLEPDNLVARRLLAQLWLQLENPAAAVRELHAAMDHHKAMPVPDVQEMGRLAFWLASAEAAQGARDRALAQLEAAEQAATQEADWLYRAFIAQLRGAVEQEAGRHAEAEAALQEAIHFHGIIRCPLGEAQTWLQLAQLSLARGQADLAEQYFSQVRALVSTHQLAELADAVPPQNTI